VELLESSLPGFSKRHTWNAANCSKLFTHSKKTTKKKRAGVLLPSLALLVLSLYSNPRNIWQNQVAQASPLHHEEAMCVQTVLLARAVLGKPPACRAWKFLPSDDEAKTV
jgi:hypothetical protein